MWHLLAFYLNYMVKKHLRFLPCIWCSQRNFMNNIDPRKKSNSHNPKGRLASVGIKGHIFRIIRVPKYSMRIALYLRFFRLLLWKWLAYREDAMQSGKVYRYFVGKYCHLLQELRVSRAIAQKEASSKRFACFSYSSSLNMEAERSSETSVSYQIERRQQTS